KRTYVLADVLPAPIILLTHAELLKRRRPPAGGKNVRALPHLPATDYELLLKCRQWLLDAHRVDPVFGPISTFKLVTPVRLPPGRFRLATSPTLTGSTDTPKAIGIVAVA